MTRIRIRRRTTGCEGRVGGGGKTEDLRAKTVFPYAPPPPPPPLLSLQCRHGARSRARARTARSSPTPRLNGHGRRRDVSRVFHTKRHAKLRKLFVVSVRFTRITSRAVVGVGKGGASKGGERGTDSTRLRVLFFATVRRRVNRSAQKTDPETKIE